MASIFFNYFYGNCELGGNDMTQGTEQNLRQKEKGFSLLELLLVVGVGALLLLAGIGTYQLVTSGSTANEAIRLIATVKQQTQRAFQGQGTYGATAGTDVVPTLVAMEAFPSGVLNAASTPIDPWGGTIAVASAGTGGPNFSITYPAVPTASCIQIGTAFTERDTDFVSLAVNATPVVFNVASPVTTAGLTAACGAAAAVPMVWTFF